MDPMIICGGMGAWISWWVMARIVALQGGLGVVSGTALDSVCARVLQQGDPGGHVRRAFAELVRLRPSLAEPIQRLLTRFFIEGGKPADKPFLNMPFGKWGRVPGRPAGGAVFLEPAQDAQVLTVASNFAEVWLAKEGHAGKVGINYLRKIERPLPWGLYGAMLAGVDYVVVGAGSPSELPGMIDSLSRHEDTALPLRVYGAGNDNGGFSALVRPRSLVGDAAAPLNRPKFLAIVSSFVLAQALAGDPKTRPYGFVVEGPEAGGHNAPPGRKSFNAQGEPTVVYTEADRADIGAIAGLGLPFWLAGLYGGPERLREALARGAAGIQFGTAAALSAQSGMARELRAKVLKLVAEDKLTVIADPRISPSGFPFKVAQVPGTLSDPVVYGARKRICDLGHLQSGYITPDGELGFRCPAEPVAEFVRKGGKVQNTVGRACLCNGLLSTCGLPQVRSGGYVEPPVVTLGDDLDGVRKMLALLPPGHEAYSIGKVMQYIQRGAAKTATA